MQISENVQHGKGGRIPDGQDMFGEVQNARIALGNGTSLFAGVFTIDPELLIKACATAFKEGTPDQRATNESPPAILLVWWKLVDDFIEELLRKSCTSHLSAGLVRMLH